MAYGNRTGLATFSVSKGETPMKRVLFALPMMLGCCVSNRVEPLRPLEIATAPYPGNSVAGATGTLAYEHGCLSFRNDAHKAVWVPVWPVGTIFNGTSLIFHQPGRADQPFVLGQELLISGQPLSWPSVPSPRASLFERQCGGIPFAVADVRPAN